MHPDSAPDAMMTAVTAAALNQRRFRFIRSSGAERVRGKTGLPWRTGHETFELSTEPFLTAPHLHNVLIMIMPVKFIYYQPDRSPKPNHPR
jgi:hypothetical protein